MAKKKSVNKKPASKKKPEKKKSAKKTDPPEPAEKAGDYESILESDRLDSFAEIAEAFNVTYDTVKNWRRCGMPGTRGNYSREEILKWTTINGKGQQSKTKDYADLEKEAVEAAAREQIGKADKVQAEAEIKKRQNRIEQGGLVFKSDCDNFLSNFIDELHVLTDRMVVDFAAGYGPKMEPKLREDLSKRMELMFNQLADKIEQLDDLEIG